MGSRKLPKADRLDTFKNFAIFNLAGIIGFILGTVAFAAAMMIFPNPTFAWLFANGVGGISHFSANYLMQRQTKEKIVKNFIIFNVTGIIGFLIATATFEITINYIQSLSTVWQFGSFAGIQDSTIAWLIGNMPGAVTHYILNNKAANLNLKLKIKTNFEFKRQTSITKLIAKPAARKKI